MGLDIWIEFYVPGHDVVRVGEDVLRKWEELNSYVSGTFDSYDKQTRTANLTHIEIRKLITWILSNMNNAVDDTWHDHAHPRALAWKDQLAKFIVEVLEQSERRGIIATYIGW